MSLKRKADESIIQSPNQSSSTTITTTTNNSDSSEPNSKKQKLGNNSLNLPNESEEENRVRFLMELEFIQALANPQYLHYLAAQTRLFQDQAFLNYLKYLQYWKNPEYAKFIVFPHCLRFLELLQEESFRKELQVREFIELIHNQQFYHWRYFRNNRLNNAGVAPPSLESVPVVKQE